MQELNKIKIPVICHDPSGMSPNTYAAKPILEFKELEPDSVRYHIYKVSLERKRGIIVKKYN